MPPFSSVTLLLAVSGGADSMCLADLALRCSRNRGRTIGSFRVLDFEDMLNVYQMANK